MTKVKNAYQNCKLSVDSYETTGAGIVCHCSVVGATTVKYDKLVSHKELEGYCNRKKVRKFDNILMAMEVLSDLINKNENRTELACDISSNVKTEAA